MGFSILPYPHAAVAFFQFGYPLKCTLEKRDSMNELDFVQWMVYWIICCLWMVLESHFLWFLIERIPFYCELKIVVMLWLTLPEYRGASWLWYSRFRALHKKFDDAHYQKFFGALKVQLPDMPATKVMEAEEQQPQRQQNELQHQQEAEQLKLQEQQRLQAAQVEHEAEQLKLQEQQQQQAAQAEQEAEQLKFQEQQRQQAAQAEQEGEQLKFQEQQQLQAVQAEQEAEQSRLVAYNAEADTKKFTDVKGFVSAEEAAKGIYHVDIPNGTPLDAVGPMPTNENDYWLLRIQDLDMVRYAGSDQLGQQRAQEKVQQGGSQILVKRKHIKVESRVQSRESDVVAYNAETETKKFTDVKGFLSVDEAARGVHHVDVPNGTRLDAVGPMPTNENDYWLLRILDLDMVSYAGSDQLGQQKAREHVRRNSNQIVIKRKHLKVNPSMQD